MNTALAVYKVEFHGSFWLVWRGNEVIPVATAQNLARVLSGETPLFEGKVKPVYETMKSYLARGGHVSRIPIRQSSPTESPPTPRKKNKPSTLTIEDLL